MTYVELVVENALLKKEIEELYEHAHRAIRFSDSNDMSMCDEIHCAIDMLAQQSSDNWATLEDVACGAGIECPTCHRQRPCLCCDHGGKT